MLEGNTGKRPDRGKKSRITHCRTGIWTGFISIHPSTVSCCLVPATITAALLLHVPRFKKGLLHLLFFYIWWPKLHYLSKEWLLSLLRSVIDVFLLAGLIKVSVKAGPRGFGLTASSRLSSFRVSAQKEANWVWSACLKIKLYIKPCTTRMNHVDSV